MTSSADPPPSILWAIKAQLSSLRHRVSPPASSGIAIDDDKITRILAATFPGQPLIIHDIFGGFRPKAEREILHVEVCKPDGRAAESYVVKVGLVDHLSKELHNWKTVRPPGMNADVVFLPVRQGCRESSGPLQGWMSIMYDDAQRFIGAEEICTLEEAARRAIRSDIPSFQSVLDVMCQLLERVGQLFHRFAKVVESNDCSSDSEIQRLKLVDTLARWDQEPRLRRIREQIDNLIQRLELPPGQLARRRYLGAVPYLQSVLKRLTPTEPPLAKVGATRETSPRLRPATRKDLVPRLLCGPAHGDLHARNVLVGLVRDRVYWPAVFDYEDMGGNKFVGWDYVKLETELKVRAYQDVFPGLQDRAFVNAVHQFELDLAERTEGQTRDRSDAMPYGQGWPAGPRGTFPADRLRAIVMAIRHLAAIHMARNRPREEWQDEYYFLLACYGVITGLFENYTEPELYAACLSAGVATAHLSWPRNRYQEEQRVLEGL